MGMSQQDTEFARAEFEKIFMEDHKIRSLCCERAHAFLPDGPAAAPIICDRILASLRDKVPVSLLRVGNGEGNAVSMTKGVLHPLQISTFYTEFLSQNGIAVPLDAAIALCRDVKRALISTDIVGFRSFRVDERSVIRDRIEGGDGYAAMGFLYAREFLQQGLIEGYWRQATITSAWIHLDVMPYLSKILEEANSIIVITGRAELRDAVLSRVGSRLEAFITVPVQGFIPQSADQSHFFKEFPIVCQELHQRDLGGKLVLVGAGLFGKVYCHIAKQNGAVAIDLGSSFDVLAGLETRPVHKEYDLSALRWI